MESELTKFKVVVIGSQGSGKTSLIASFLQQKFQEKCKPTEAVKQQAIRVDLQNMSKAVNLELWDLPGKESFMILNRMYLRDTNAALIVYDVTSMESYNTAQKWMDELRESAPNDCVWALCGNKMDVTNSHAVSLSDCSKLAG